MKDILKNLFHSLNDSNIDYLILRGYENLPESFSNDLDFSVINESVLENFLEVIREVGKKHNLLLERHVIRVGLLKLFLKNETTLIKIDVFYLFQYAGLLYLDSTRLHKTKRKTKNGIPIPEKNYELTTSLLKEILHNSRIRKDKKIGLQRLYAETEDINPFNEYFSLQIGNSIINALHEENNFVFYSLARKTRGVLLLKNIKKHGIFLTFKNIIQFFLVKYFNQKKMDRLLV